MRASFFVCLVLLLAGCGSGPLQWPWTDTTTTAPTTTTTAPVETPESLLAQANANFAQDGFAGDPKKPNIWTKPGVKSVLSIDGGDPPLNVTQKVRVQSTFNRSDGTVVCTTYGIPYGGKRNYTLFVSNLNGVKTAKELGEKQDCVIQ